MDGGTDRLIPVFPTKTFVLRGYKNNSSRTVGDHNKKLPEIDTYLQKMLKFKGRQFLNQREVTLQD